MSEREELIREMEDARAECAALVAEALVQLHELRDALLALALGESSAERRAKDMCEVQQYEGYVYRLRVDPILAAYHREREAAAALREIDAAPAPQQ